MLSMFSIVGIIDKYLTFEVKFKMATTAVCDVSKHKNDSDSFIGSKTKIYCPPHTL